MNLDPQILTQLTRIADSLEKLAECTELFDARNPEYGRAFCTVPNNDRTLDVHIAGGQLDVDTAER